MEQIFSKKNALALAAKNIVDILLLNFLWLLFCVPMFTIGLSTTACLDVAQREIRKKGGQVISAFFGSVKRNWKQGLVAGFLLSLLTLSLVADIALLRIALKHGSVWGNAWVLFAVFLVFTLVYSLWVFFYIANYEIALKVLMKNALLLMIGYLPLSVGLATVLIVAGLCVYLLPGSIFVTPILCVLFCNRILHNAFDKHRDMCKKESKQDCTVESSPKVVL